MTAAVPLRPDPAPRKPLTPRQQLALTLILRSITDRGYPPTVRELGAGLGLSSSNSVVFVLQRLQAKGYLDRDAGVTRGMRVLP